MYKITEQIVLCSLLNVIRIFCMETAKKYLDEIDAGMSLSRVPVTDRSQKLCDHAVMNNQYELVHVPAANRTKLLCENAVSRSGWMIQYVPEELLTEKMCLIAVENDVRSIEFIPEELKTKKVCDAALNRFRHLTQYEQESIEQFFPAKCKDVFGHVVLSKKRKK